MLDPSSKVGRTTGQQNIHNCIDKPCSMRPLLAVVPLFFLLAWDMGANSGIGLHWAIYSAQNFFRQLGI